MKKKAAIILTTHSLDEAQRLCDRISIMVNGQLTCLGSAQRLKNRYGRSLELRLRLTGLSDSNAGGEEDETRGVEVEQIFSEGLAYVMQATRNTSRYSSSGGESLKQRLASIQLTPTQAEYVRHEFLRYVQVDDEEKAEEKKDDRSTHTLQSTTGSLTALTVVEEASVERSFRMLDEFLRSSMMKSSAGLASCTCELLERPSLVSCRYRILLASDNEAGVRKGERGQGFGRLFALLEPNKKKLHIAEYSLGQVTLEQVFNHFAAQQTGSE